MSTDPKTEHDPKTVHGAFSWVEFQGEDAAAARAFYDRVLGWPITEMEMQDGSTYPAVVAGEQPVGGFSPKPVRGGSWLAYVTVDDVDARARAAAEAGGKIVSEPSTAPGVGRIAVVEDPFGAALAFIAYENGNG